MSYLQRKANAMVGVRAYVASVSYLGYLKPKKLSELMCEFLKSINHVHVKWNSRYKGLNTADIANAIYVQQNFDQFKKYIRQNYPNGQIPFTPPAKRKQ